MKGKKEESMVCPITDKIMVDPVTASDGHHYEREAIEKWIAESPGDAVSPATGEVLTSELLPNPELKKAIQKRITDAAENLRDALLENRDVFKQVNKMNAEVGVAAGAGAEIEAGNPSRFQFAALPKDLRTLITVGYFKRLPLSERKRLAVAAQASKSPQHQELYHHLKDDIKETNHKVRELLNHVVTANIAAAQALLEEDPGLLLEAGDAENMARQVFKNTGHAKKIPGRIFKGTTAFRLAVWTQHTGMREMMKGIFERQGWHAKAAEQFRQQMNPDDEVTKAHGEVCTATDRLHKGLEAYVKKYKDMPKDKLNKRYESGEVTKDWCEGVGVWQLELPACEVLRYENALWCQQDVTAEVPWVADSMKALKSWGQCGTFVLGTDFAWRRGPGGGGAVAVLGRGGRRGLLARVLERVAGGGDQGGLDTSHDTEVLAKILTKQSRELAELKSFYAEQPMLSMDPKG